MYAIDFGTSNTVVARWNETTQMAETLSLPEIAWQLKGNPPLVPSLLYVEKAGSGSAGGPTLAATTIAGQAVRDRGLDLASDPRFFRNFKRGIGTSVQGFMPELDGHVISFEQIGGWFLQQVVGQLKARDPALDSLVLTVPVDSFEAYRLWLGKVCRTLDIQQVRLLDEPTAAALGYQLSPAHRTLLVVDFGGGTLDFSLVQPTFSAEKPPGFLLQWGKKSRARQSVAKRSPKTVRVLAKAGENLGGADIDRWLADHFAQTQSLPINSLTLRLVEKLKIGLSAAATASEAYFDEETLDTYDLSLDREQFEQILTDQGFFARLDNRLDQVMQQAQRQNISAADVDAVLLVGGSAQIPAVQTWIARHFDPSKIKSDRPFEAVAQGALQLQKTQLQDFLYHSYGIRYWDRRNNAHSWHPIIQRGQPYPTTDPVEFFLGASSENQPSIELIVGELGDRTAGSMEVYFEGDQLVTRRANDDATAAQVVQALNDRAGARTIAKLSPPGFPGSDRIRILFSIDADRFLRMTVEDLLTSETLLNNQAVVQLS
ncbi:MAG: Hsp70 family protein [Cyanobacteria bacterium J06606_4]